MCKVLEVSRSGYYAWRKRLDQAVQVDELGEAVEQMYFACHQRYGSPRLAVELQRSGISVSRTTVAKKLQERGLKAKTRRTYRPMTTDSKHNEPIAPNLLERNFQTDQRGQVWVSDITYLHHTKGFLYLTVILDLYDRKAVGWSISEGLSTQETTLPAWRMAQRNHPPKPGVMLHSDRGVQYAAAAFRNTLAKHGVRQSMSRKGNCWDNAVAESFFKSLKVEAIYGFRVKEKEALKALLFDYLECWYNRKRRHSHLNFNSILEQEILDGIYFNQVA